MSNLTQAIATTIRHLTNVNSEGPASFDDLVALNSARDCINQLFSDCVDELGADPASEPLWTAIASALELSAPVSSRKPYGSQSTAAQGSRADTRVAKFWDTFADQFAWDLLPTGFLHALYGHWMAERFPREATLSKTAFTRRVKAAAIDSGKWSYTRSRPGSLMDAAEPLAKLASRWSHDGSDDAIYGLRRVAGRS